MRYLRAPWRIVKMILGLNFEPAEPVDVSAEAQLLGTAKRLEELGFLAERF